MGKQEIASQLFDSQTIINHSHIKQNAMNTNLESGYIHLTASEKETILNLFELLKSSFRPDMAGDPDAFVITNPVIVKADKQSFFDINQISLKLINQITNNG